MPATKTSVTVFLPEWSDPWRDVRPCREAEVNKATLLLGGRVNRSMNPYSRYLFSRRIR